MYLCFIMSFEEKAMTSTCRMKEHLFVFVLDRFTFCLTGDFLWNPVLNVSASLSSARQLILAAFLSRCNLSKSVSHKLHACS